MAKNKRWKNFEFTLTDADSNEWCCEDLGGELLMTAWETVIEVRGGDHDRSCQGRGRGFVSALNAALTEAKASLKRAQFRVHEMQEVVDEANEDVEQFFYLVNVIDPN